MTTAVTDAYFTTVEDADAVLAKRLGTAAWTAASSATKIIALQQATSEIDALDYAGVDQSQGQARKFPRKYLVDITEPSPWSQIVILDMYGYWQQSIYVPDKVMLACALEALALIQFYADSDNTDRAVMADQGVKNYNIGGVYSETLGVSNKRFYGLYSREASRLLEDYIESATIIV